VSNQAGINRGALTEAQLEEIHARMLVDAEAAGGRIEAVYHCPHDWDEGCDCRKPAPGMLFQAQRELDLDLTRTPFIGDDERDGQAADAAGCPSIQVHEGFTLLDAVRELVGEPAEAVAR
jgi:histidinol-phosphate phosphatase family protein